MIIIRLQKSVKPEVMSGDHSNCLLETRNESMITEGRGFKSHLELGFFSEFAFDAKTYQLLLFLTETHFGSL